MYPSQIGNYPTDDRKCKHQLLPFRNEVFLSQRKVQSDQSLAAASVCLNFHQTNWLVRFLFPAVAWQHSESLSQSMKYLHPCLRYIACGDIEESSQTHQRGQDIQMSFC